VSNCSEDTQPEECSSGAQAAPASDEVERCVQAVMAQGLCGPVVFLLEACKPLRGCLREVYLCCEPVVRLFGSGEVVRNFATVLASAESVEHFIQRLEAARDSAGGR
jgi:hypothetical protein